MGTEADFMKAAIDEACKGVTDGHGGPFGAVVVKDGKIIAIGHNQVKDKFHRATAIKFSATFYIIA